MHPVACNTPNPVVRHLRHSRSQAQNPQGGADFHVEQLLTRESRKFG
jgi:hypothetical protein